MSRPQIIASTGGKGGAGKTVLSILLCRELARMGKKVALIDVDLGTPNVHTKLGLKQKDFKRQTLQRALAQPEWLESSLIEVKSIGKRHVKGGRFSILSSLGDFDLRSFGNWDEHKQDQFYSQFKALIEHFSQLDEAASFDVVVLDTRAGIDGNVCDFCMLADDRVIFTGAEDTLREDALSLLKMLYFYDLEEDQHSSDSTTTNWIVANKADDEGQANSVSQWVVNALGKWFARRKMADRKFPRYLGWIPEIEIPREDGTLMEANDEAADRFRQLAEDLCCRDDGRGDDDIQDRYLRDLTT
ncbi:MAG: AAA family ATPase [Planctomycetota bacterium]|nr:AAA family ATPase [Planctomycetota bacterium]